MKNQWNFLTNLIIIALIIYTCHICVRLKNIRTYCVAIYVTKMRVSLIEVCYQIFPL